MPRKPLAITALMASFVLSSGGPANTAEIKVLGSTGVKGILTELAKQFEASTDHTVVAEFDVFAVLKRRIDAGEAFDIAILSPSMIDDLIKQGKIAVGTSVVVGRTGMGVAVYNGGPKPDISSVEAFRRAMLSAKSVGYPKEGASGTYFLLVLDRLGIARDMKARLRPFEGGGPSLQDFAAGDPELVVGGTTLFPAMSGAEPSGAFPPELQSYIVFSAAVSTTAKEPLAAGSLIQFLVSPAALPVIKIKGMEPG